jgi:D-alanyl-D-alanine carboxypeptidase/D-alanyl-D-alanine-endopeptidase (penicillin-binding protein 4)
MQKALTILLWVGALAMAVPARAAGPLPATVMAAVRESGVPLGNFGFHAQPVDTTDAADAKPLASLNAEQPFLLASTTKVVTSLAALGLLGAAHPSPLRAYASAPLRDGHLTGNLVIVGYRHAISAAELGRWFAQMHAQGLHSIKGQIVLLDLPLLSDHDPAIAGAELARGDYAPPPPTASGWSDQARNFNKGTMLLAIEPTAGERARISLTPQPLGVQVINDVMMGGPCDAWARWSTPAERGDGPPQLQVRGRWSTECPREYVAYVHALPGMKFMPNVVLPPAAAAAPAAPEPPKARRVAQLWAESGGTLVGRVVDGSGSGGWPSAAAAKGWSSEFGIPLARVVREINKTSDNLAACNLLLSLAPPSAPPGREREGARSRVQDWLITQGLADGDIRVDVGSGQSRAERGKPRAMVALLRRAWIAPEAQAFVNSLPIAGVDGTLVNRLRQGPAVGQAFLKTGTLSDTRALAGYVRSQSGTVYAVTAIVNHPQAARARNALDAFIAWVVKNG